MTLVRPERSERADSDEKRLDGQVIRELDQGIVYTLFFKLDCARLTSDRDYDMEIRIGGHTYRVLDIGRRKQWSIALKRSAVHLMRASQ